MFKLIKYWHWFLLSFSYIGLILCIVLLLNFTAANPTKRRYASQNPLMTGDSFSIGNSAENILSKDLGIPNNNTSDQLHCICNTNETLPQNFCKACFAHIPISTSYRLPDFVDKHFLAESKNVQNLRRSSDDYSQLQDYASAAKRLDIPLWVYVRTNTKVDSAYDELVESTGGDVVYYFPTADYNDVTDKRARRGLGVFSLLLILSLARMYLLWRKPPKTVQIRVIKDQQVG